MTKIYCPGIVEDAAGLRDCDHALGTKIPTSHGTQVMSEEGVRVLSAENGALRLLCPRCGGGYTWHMQVSAPVELVREKLAESIANDWATCRFRWDERMGRERH